MPPKQHKFIRIATQSDTVIYEVSTIKSNSLDINKPILCPCCGEVMPYAFDIIQYGMFEDKFISLFTCNVCGKAWWYTYTVGAIELIEATDAEAELH